MLILLLPPNLIALHCSLKSSPKSFPPSICLTPTKCLKNVFISTNNSIKYNVNFYYSLQTICQYIFIGYTTKTNNIIIYVLLVISNKKKKDNNALQALSRINKYCYTIDVCISWRTLDEWWALKANYFSRFHRQT